MLRWNATLREDRMAKDKKTSPKVASKAAKIVSDPKSSATVKSVAGSALTQAQSKKPTKPRPGKKG